MEALQRQLASLAPRHTLFMQTAMAPLSLRSLICHPDIMRTSLDQSVSAGMGEHVPLSMLQGAAVVCLVGIGHPKVGAPARQLAGSVGTCAGWLSGSVCWLAGWLAICGLVPAWGWSREGGLVVACSEL